MLNALVDLIWIFGVVRLIWWIMESPNYDFEELIKLFMQVSELIEAL